jgi:hypothetical protein
MYSGPASLVNQCEKLFGWKRQQRLEALAVVLFSTKSVAVVMAVMMGWIKKGQIGSTAHFTVHEPEEGGKKAPYRMGKLGVEFVKACAFDKMGKLGMEFVKACAFDKFGSLAKVMMRAPSFCYHASSTTSRGPNCNEAYVVDFAGKLDRILALGKGSRPSPLRRW